MVDSRARGQVSRPSPATTTTRWFKIDKPGVYRGQCANLCGRGHARMIATVRAEDRPQFDIWLANQKRMLEEAEGATRARERTDARSSRSSTGPGQVENP